MMRRLLLGHLPVVICAFAVGVVCWGPVVSVYASYVTKPGGAASFYQTIEDDGVAVTQRPTFNIIGGTVADDAGNSRTNITLAGGGNVTTSATLTTGLPVVGNGTVDVDIGTRSGNTTEYMNGDGGGYTSGNCAEFDANGNITDSGAGCGSGGGVSGWVLVDTDTVSGASQIFLEGMDTSASRWMVNLYNLVLSAAAQLELEVSTDTGSSFETTSYQTYSLRYSSSQGTSAITNSVNATTELNLTGNGGIGSASTDSFGGRLYIWNPGSTALYKLFEGSAQFMSASTSQLAFFGGSWSSAAAIDSLRVIPQSGTVTGTGRLYKWQD